jgi:hypothetical protein
MLVCDGVPEQLGASAAKDITEEFRNRPWHKKAICSWDGALLFLTAENDFDEDGKALRDEFSDAISACISEGFDGDINLMGIVQN